MRRFATLSILLASCGPEGADGFSEAEAPGPADIVCTPQAVDFEAVDPGSCVQAEVLCRTEGPGRARFLSARIGGNSSPDFSLTSAPPETQLSTPEDVVELTVAYCPETLGDDAGVAILSFEQRDLEVFLQGSGGGPNILVSPSQVNFGLTSLLAPSRRTVLFSHVYDGEILEYRFRIEQEEPGAFFITGTSTATLAPGESFLIEFEFRPPGPGDYEATLVVEFDGREGPKVLRIRMRASAIEPIRCSYEVSKPGLNFGIVEVGRGTSRPVEIRNLSHTGRCLVTSLGLSPESDPAFSLLGGPLEEVFIEPAGTLTATVAVQPTVPGRLEGSLELSISNPDAPFLSIPLEAVAE